MLPRKKASEAGQVAKNTESLKAFPFHFSLVFACATAGPFAVDVIGWPFVNKLREMSDNTA